MQHLNFLFHVNLINIRWARDQNVGNFFFQPHVNSFRWLNPCSFAKYRRCNMKELINHEQIQNQFTFVAYVIVDKKKELVTPSSSNNVKKKDNLFHKWVKGWWILFDGKRKRYFLCEWKLRQWVTFFWRKLTICL